MSVTGALSRHVTTSDGVQLHYLDAGSGRPLVLVHGILYWLHISSNCIWMRCVASTG